HHYKKAANYFSKIPTSQFSDKTAQIQYLQTLRAAENYALVDQLITTFNLENKYKEQWGKAALKLKNNGVYTIFSVGCAFGESFLGGISSENGLIMAINKKDATNKTGGYRLAFFKKENDTTLVAKKVSYLTAKLSNESIFEGNPANFGQDKIIFCKNTSDSKWFKDKKIGKLNLSKKGESLLRLYVLDKNSQTVEELPALINQENKNTVTPFYDVTHQILFFSQSNKEGKYNIYYAKQNEKEWAKPILLKGINTSFDEVYPFIVVDKIYFSSRGRTGLGGLDIFMGELSFEEELSVVNIKNLGKPMNSGADDFGLFFTAKQTGYLASNRNGENGNDELFRFVYNPSDMVEGMVIDDNGKPVAATMFIYEKDETGIWQIKDTLQLAKNGEFKYKIDIDKKYRFDVNAAYLKSKTVYFPSEDANELRGDSKGFFKEIVLEGIDIEGEIKDAITGKPIVGAVIKFYENGVLIDSTLTNKNGEWRKRLDRNKNYDIELDALNYDKKTFEIRDKSDRNRKQFLDDLKNIKLLPEAKKDVIVKIDNIYFDYNAADIKIVSYPILDNIVAFLTAKPTTRIELGAHTDCEGGNAYNMKLSQKRAKSCYNYIIDKGIAKNRLIPKGYGETQIINGCVRPGQCSKKENEVNRRIEVKFLK
ncbi:MAG: OmpA family protein, partial [Flavobacteriales bacterium]|nr:OmpA family protein [Flavobacteriales bacterium]